MFSFMFTMRTLEGMIEISLRCLPTALKNIDDDNVFDDPMDVAGIQHGALHEDLWW